MNMMKHSLSKQTIGPAERVIGGSTFEARVRRMGNVVGVARVRDVTVTRLDRSHNNVYEK